MLCQSVGSGSDVRAQSLTWRWALRSAVGSGAHISFCLSKVEFSSGSISVSIIEFYFFLVYL